MVQSFTFFSIIKLALIHLHSVRVAGALIMDLCIIFSRHSAHICSGWRRQGVALKEEKRRSLPISADHTELLM